MRDAAAGQDSARLLGARFDRWPSLRLLRTSKWGLVGLAEVLITSSAEARQRLRDLSGDVQTRAATRRDRLGPDRRDDIAKASQLSASRA